ncbi:MAG: diaminopropionate ammonia-lyase [Dehalococcoidales bacterium]|nr:diaminopropionate ammonia-lyase [Dehalococcoidales bacterium]
MIRLVPNINFPTGFSQVYSFEETALVRKLHEMIPGYQPTPLVSLDDLARKLGVKRILVKDESKRFRLNSFKGLGGTYAMFRIICRELELDPGTATLNDIMSHSDKISRMEFVTTTDGNHGKGVSWAAKLFGCRAHVYMPKGSRPVRAQAICEAGSADVEITGLSYDDCVRMTARLAEEKGHHLIQDTSWAGYEEIPTWIMQGYTTLFYEAVDQMQALGIKTPTHIFLQAGVGSMAGAIAAAAQSAYEKIPVITLVEPEAAACFFDSFAANDDASHPAIGDGQTIMAGLNCGEVCSIAWNILKTLAKYSIACSDDITMRGMNILAHPDAGDPVIISGESGAVTAGLIDALLSDDRYNRILEQLGLGASSVILLINTEGNTDPDNYDKIIRGA